MQNQPWLHRFPISSLGFKKWHKTRCGKHKWQITPQSVFPFEIMMEKRQNVTSDLIIIQQVSPIKQKKEIFA
jgi:hypothetical protein